jgi:uncharacterized protein
MDAFVPSLGTLAVALVLATGAALQGCVGIGFAVLSAPLLLLIAPELVPGPVLLLGCMLAAMTTSCELRSVHVRDLGLAMMGRVAGTLVAGATIALLPLSLFGLAFSLMILAAVALSLGRWRVLPTPRNLVAAGMLSGYMGTLTSVGSPPIGLVYQNMPGPRMRATISAFFMLGAGFSILTLAAVGRFTLQQVIACAWLVPPVVLGFLVSRRLVGHVDRSRDGIKLTVLGVSALAALVLLAKSVA